MEEINLKDFFMVIKKKVFLITIISVLVSFSVLMYSTFVKVPMYETYTTLVLTQSQNNESDSITQNDIAINQKLVYTYSEIIKSKRVLNQVISNLNLDYKVNELSKLVSVNSIENTEILKISVKNEDAKMSKTIANNIAKVFSNEVVEIYDINNVSIIDKAVKTKEVSNDTTVRDTILAFLIGAFGTIVVLLILYYFDDTIKNSDDLEEQINLPIVGKVGLDSVDKKNPSRDELIVFNNPKSVISEGIKTLRTSLQFSSIDNKLKTLLITSSIPGEGKSFISSNLSVAFAQTGKRVLLVDCDMRKARQHKIFRLSNEKGLSNLIIDDIELNYAKYIKTTKVKNLYLLPSGTIPPNPSELLNSNKNKKLVEFLSSKFDLVIFDGVPCNGLPDSVIMSTLVDETLIVSADSITPKDMLNNTKKLLSNVNANIVGVLLNKVNMSESKYYGKYYSYYGDEK